MFSSIKSGLEGLEAGPLYGGGATCAMNSYELHSHFYFVTKKQTFENINFNKNTETSFSIKKKKKKKEKRLSSSSYSILCIPDILSSIQLYPLRFSLDFWTWPDTSLRQSVTQLSGSLILWLLWMCQH